MATKRATIRLNHVNHVVYIVRDKERSLAFYRDILGLKVIPKMVDAENIEWLQLPSGVMVHLIQTDLAPAPNPCHTAFEVEDFDATVKSLEALGITIENRGVRKDGQRFLFIRDPDGNRVELCTRSGFGVVQ